MVSEWVKSNPTGSNESFQSCLKCISSSFLFFLAPKSDNATQRLRTRRPQTTWWKKMHLQATNKKKRKKKEIWTFNCLSFHFYCKRAKFNFDFCGWVGLEGSGVLTLFQFCPCWTRPPLTCFLVFLFNILPHPVPPPVNLLSCPVPIRIFLSPLL